MRQIVLSILVENTPGVLSRISGLFTRRGYNIDSHSTSYEVTVKKNTEVSVRLVPASYKVTYKVNNEQGKLLVGKDTEYWVAVVKPGRVLFEISGVPEDVAKEALRLATHKLPCKCKVVSRADLEGGVSNENTIAVNIRRLREKIEDNPAAPVYIKNIRGLGYIWNQEVRQSIDL